MLLGAACLSLAVATQPMARPDISLRADTVRFLDAAPADVNPSGVKPVAKAFVQAMAAGDAEALWMFATEEEHDAFQVKQVAFDAYAEDFPVLTRAKEATVVRVWPEGDADFIAMIVRDRSDRTYWAEMGFWLDDAGDWKVISLDIKPTADYVAGL
jgi:hypothetical protein